MVIACTTALGASGIETIATRTPFERAVDDDLADPLVAGLAVVVERVAPVELGPQLGDLLAVLGRPAASSPWSTDGLSETPTAMPTDRAMNTAISDTMW